MKYVECQDCHKVMIETVARGMHAYHLRLGPCGGWHRVNCVGDQIQPCETCDA